MAFGFAVRFVVYDLFGEILEDMKLECCMSGAFACSVMAHAFSYRT